MRLMIFLFYSLNDNSIVKRSRNGQKTYKRKMF